MEDLRFVLSRMLRQHSLLPATILLTIARCALVLYLPLLMAEAVEAAVMLHDMSSIGTVGFRMLLVTLAMGACGYASNMVCAVSGQRFALATREEAYSRICELSVEQASNMGYGSLITRLTTDVNTCSNLLYSVVQFFIEPIALVAGGIVMMWIIVPQLGIVFFVFVLIQFAILATLVRRTAPGFMKVRIRVDQLNARLLGTLASFRLSKASNTSTHEREHVEKDNHALFAAGLDVQRKIALFNPLIMLIMNLAVACVLLIAGSQVAQGNLHVSMALSAMSYSEQVLLSIASMGHLYRVVTETQPSAARIRSLLDTQPNMTDGPLVWDEVFSELSLQNVAFRYSNNTKVFDGLNLRIRTKEFLAVVGPIGCGKTTLANLCSRMYDTTSGQVLINGRDVRSFGLQDVRREVALVQKDTVVLEDTVLDNIVFGREGVSQEDVSRAVQVAQLGQLLKKLPQGLNTQLYAHGKSLSGGERQRLTIARALAGNPGLLVLDDSTSSLDYLTESRLLTEVRRRYPNMAVLLVTNRLASALMADRIAVIDNGQIIAVGTDESLRASCPHYIRMCELQEDER